MQESFSHINNTKEKLFIQICFWTIQTKKIFNKITSCEQKVNKLNFHLI